MKRLMISFLICSGCASVQRPDTNIYGVNKSAGKLRGYNLKSDYNSDGTRKPGAQPKERPFTDIDNGWVCTDARGFKNLTVYVQDLRDAYERECK